jgi:hypothetical protein
LRPQPPERAAAASGSEWIAAILLALCVIGYIWTLQQQETAMLNLTGGVVLICVAVVMVWFASKPADGESHRFFKSAWIVGQLYVMTALVLFVMGSAAILANI